MKPPRWLRCVRALVLVLWFAACTAHAESWNDVMDVIGLLPASDQLYGPAGPEYLEEQIGKKLTDAERDLLARKADGAWKTFSDDLISFEIPDDPLLKIDVRTPEERPRLGIVGGAVGSTDRSFSRVYRLTFGGGIPYGLILVSENSWFDTGICFCGAVSLRTLVPADGNLLELSQLSNGDVKKFQAINDTHRAVLFEWTHSAITQEAYARIGASMRLKPASERTGEEWRQFATEQRKQDGSSEWAAGLGWLRVGTEEEELRRLLGPPSEVVDGDWIYRQEQRQEDGGGWVSMMRLPVRQGKVTQFSEDWSTSEDLAPTRGSEAWYRDTIRAWQDSVDELEEGQSPDLPEEEVAFMLGEFHERAVKATGREWDRWCGVIADLADLGVKDERALHLILSRGDDQTLHQFYTRSVLDAYARPELEPFVYARLDYLLSASEDDSPPLGECHNLLASLEKDWPRTTEFLARASAHPSDKARRPAAYFVYKLPAEEARIQCKAFLADPDRDVRHAAAIMVGRVFGGDDLPWLRETLAAEEDHFTKEALERAIEKLGE